MKSINLYKRICLLCVLSFLIQNMKATGYEKKFISTINGLSNSSVNCIIEDKEHTMWFGTWGGLNSYNGRDIKVYRYSNSNKNTLSNNTVRQIIETGNYLWIATDNGINRLDKDNNSIKRYYLNISKKNIPLKEKTYILAKDKQNSIYCLVKNKGLYKHNTGGFSKIRIDFIKKITSFSIYKTYIIFLMDDNSVKYCNISHDVNIIREKKLKKVNIAIRGISVNKDVLLTFSKNIITMYNRNMKPYKKIILPHYMNISSVLSKNSKLYISIDKGECKIYDTNTSSLSNLDPIAPHTPILSMFISSQNILWLGTDGRGVEQIYRHTPLFKTVLSDFPVRCFCKYNDKEVLVGTKGGGLMLLDSSNGKIHDFKKESNGLNSNSVYSLCRNSKGDIFIGSDGAGLNIINSHTGRITKLNSLSNIKSVYNICFTNNESVIWIATAGYGLVKANIKEKNGKYYILGTKIFSSSERQNPLNNDVIYALFPYQNNIWFGSRGGGLNFFNATSSQISKFKGMESLTNEDILCINGDKNNIWVGTSYGMNIIRKSPSGYKLETMKDKQLADKTIHGIIKDSYGTLWLSTNNGLYRINKNGRIENYTIKDGLQNDEFSDGAYYIDNKGFLFLGGVSGLNYFNPKKIHHRNFIPDFKVSSIRINDKDTLISNFIKDNKLRLKYEERNLIISFIAKDYINNESCEYAYRLDNSSDWVQMGTNPDIVLQLSYGKHILEVKCSNSDKVWNKTPLKIDITIEAPWWLSSWALICYTAIFIMIAFTITFIIRNRIKTNRKFFLEDIMKQQNQKIYETKLSFFTNVAHELFTPLTLIYSPAHYLSEMQEVNGKVKKYIQIIKENADKLQKLMQAIMEIRKGKSEEDILCPETFDTNEFINSVVMPLKSMYDKIDFETNIHDLHKFSSDKSILSEIIYKLISNAFYHTYTGGKVYMEVHQLAGDMSALRLTVKNSCHGLTKLQIHELLNEYNIFEEESDKDKSIIDNTTKLNIIKNKVLELDGHISAKRDKGKFIEITVDIPSLNMSKTEVSESGKDRNRQVNQNGDDTSKKYMETEILIIEDDYEIQQLLHNILYNYNIKLFTDTTEALSSLKSDRPDLIIADMHVKHSGIALIDDIKSNPKLNYIPLIGISDETSVEEQIEAYKRGIDIYIIKPFHPRQILSSVENLLSRQSILKDYFNSSMSSITIKNGKALYEEDIQIMYKVNNYIMNNISNEDLSPEILGDYLGMSKASFYRKFKELTDKTPSDYIKRMRLEYAAKLLKTTKKTVSEIIFDTGFSNKSYFYREFKSIYDCSPNDYRKNSILN